MQVYTSLVKIVKNIPKETNYDVNWLYKIFKLEKSKNISNF